MSTCLEHLQRLEILQNLSAVKDFWGKNFVQEIQFKATLAFSSTLSLRITVYAVFCFVKWSVFTM